VNRRHFLKASLPLAAAAAGLAGCRGGCDCGTSLPGSPPGLGASQFPPLNWVAQDASASDYRPAIDALGQQVLFERTPAGGLTTLYLAKTLDAATASPFLTAANNPGTAIPPSQTRPDWCWATGTVALNGAATNTAVVSVYLANADGTGLAPVNDSLGWLYPIWSRDGSQLIVYNNKGTAVPRPSTSLIRPGGKVETSNLNGKDANGDALFGGFAAPHPGNPTRIAYAGQPDLAGFAPAPTTACPADPSGYNQCYNYPFLNSGGEGTYKSAPLEAGANLTTFDAKFQGRAPYWSPDGKYLLFESDRAGGYAIFLVNMAAGKPPVQVTDASYGAQHAKFFPTGDRIILTALQKPGTANSNRSIAWVDISGYL
jgi:hypothetical protein